MGAMSDGALTVAGKLLFGFFLGHAAVGAWTSGQPNVAALWAIGALVALGSIRP